MSGRPTAEIEADLREWCDDGDPEFPDEVAIHREAADRLADLEAEMATMHRTVVHECCERIVDIDAILPPCPTCGGTGEINKPVLVPSNEVKPGARFYLTTPCPENGGNCDGKVTIKRLVAVFNAVFDNDHICLDFDYRYHLRSVR